MQKVIAFSTLFDPFLVYSFFVYVSGAELSLISSWKNNELIVLFKRSARIINNLKNNV
jgi:hypothetical protein